MSAVIATQPKLVQQTFDWDVSPWQPQPEPEVRLVPAKRTPKLTVPTVRQTSCARRGRCEHVGGVMANVLGKYGIGLDDLLSAIEDLRAKRG